MPTSDFQRARERAWRLLARRARSRRELTRRLEAAGFAPEVVARVVESLAESGLVDDLSFARQWVRWRLQEHPLGVRGLACELREKGVPGEIIAQALADVDEERQFRDALKLARRRLEKTGAGYSRAKTAAFLGRRGYAYEIISRVCRCLEAGDGDEP